jgi:nucleoside-diphosphate-sugar epimerase
MALVDVASQPQVPVMRIGVTGSSGFVGRHLVTWLQERGHRVTSITRSETGPRTSLLGNVSQVRRVASYANVDDMCAAFMGLDAVVHLAARAHVLSHESTEAAKALFTQANLDTALAAAIAAQRAGCGRFVLVSSIGVNGNATQGRPFTEQDVPHPVEPYAQSKWLAEQAVHSQLENTATQLTIVRPPLVYGPGCPGNFYALLKLIRRLPVLPFGALHARRSYIGVHNLCSALELAASHPGCANHNFVLSDGEDIDLASLVRRLADGMGRRLVWHVSVPTWTLRTLASVVGRQSTFDKLAGELRVNSSSFRRLTQWQPPMTLGAGLDQTAAAFASSARA